MFATGSDAQAALEAGADVVGGEDLIARIQSGDLPFDRAIATPELMSMVSKIGKVSLWIANVSHSLTFMLRS